MKQYETVFILTPVLSDVQMKDAVADYKEFLKANGAEIINEENWGLKNLAYAIENKQTGFYNLFEFKSDPTLVAKLDLKFRRDEKVLRYLNTNLDKFAAEYSAKRKSGAFNKSK